MRHYEGVLTYANHASYHGQWDFDKVKWLFIHYASNKIFKSLKRESRIKWIWPSKVYWPLPLKHNNMFECLPLMSQKSFSLSGTWQINWLFFLVLYFLLLLIKSQKESRYIVKLTKVKAVLRGMIWLTNTHGRPGLFHNNRFHILFVCFKCTSRNGGKKALMFHVLLILNFVILYFLFHSNKGVACTKTLIQVTIMKVMSIIKNDL